MPNERLSSLCLTVCVCLSLSVMKCLEGSVIFQGLLCRCHSSSSPSQRSFCLFFPKVYERKMWKQVMKITKIYMEQQEKHTRISTATTRQPKINDELLLQPGATLQYVLIHANDNFPPATAIGWMVG